MRLVPVEIPCISRIALYHNRSETMMSATFAENEMLAAWIFACRYDQHYQLGYVLIEDEQATWAYEILAFLGSVGVTDECSYVPEFWNIHLNDEGEDFQNFQATDLIDDFENFDQYPTPGTYSTQMSRKARVDFVMSQLKEWETAQCKSKG